MTEPLGKSSFNFGLACKINKCFLIKSVIIVTNKTTCVVAVHFINFFNF